VPRRRAPSRRPLRRQSAARRAPACCDRARRVLDRAETDRRITVRQQGSDRSCRSIDRPRPDGARVPAVDFHETLAGAVLARFVPRRKPLSAGFIACGPCPIIQGRFEKG
jgi:hypothetical protein